MPRTSFALGSVEITLESLSASHAVEKLARGGVTVLGARMAGKNTVVLRVAQRDVKKTFAILRSSCYNIKKVEKRGLSRLLSLAVRSAGLLVGAVLFLGIVAFGQGRVLDVKIVGNGAYYEREVRAILREEGVVRFCAAPKETGKLTAAILSLPRVEFCAFSLRAGVFTVEVQCAEETEPLAGKPLLAPATGVVDELVVVRGTPLVSVGDEVEQGTVCVADYVLVGENRRQVLVLAKIRVKFPVSKEYGGSEEEARAQVFLDYGADAEIRMTKTERGWLAEGEAFSTAAVGLG